MTQRGRRTAQDKFIEDWPWFGGKPGKAAIGVFTLWFVILCILAVLIILAFVTRHICTAVFLILLTAAIALLPRLFLYGSRI
ncbi:MAG: hypothetical protein ACUVT7_04895 [Thermoplasmata archaeon]